MNIYTDEAWSVVLSDKGDSLIIKTTDYHAGPLKLPLAAIGMAVKSVGTPEVSNKHVAGKRPADMIEVGRQGRYVLMISKKDKRIFIGTQDDAEAPLTLSQKELYALGKKMNKRVRKTSQIKI
jgi:hypothetical protein